MDDTANTDWLAGLMRLLRWGILGTARINRRVIPAMRLARRSHLVAVASRTRARADAYAADWQIDRACEGYQSLLDDPGIDAVYIPLPNSQHVPWTMAAVAAGKHVLCEKPMALDPADIDRIRVAATAARVVVEEGLMYRHEPLTAKVLELVHGGALGTVRAIVSGFTFALSHDADVRLDPALGGGSLWDVGCYPVSYARLLAGRDPKMVFGSAQWHATGVDDEFMGMLRYPGGTTATIYSGFRAALRTWLELLGSEGALTVPNPFKPGVRETLALERGGHVETIEVAGSPTLFVREIENFEASVLDGAPSVVTLADSRDTAATLLALLNSARDVTALYPEQVETAAPTVLWRLSKRSGHHGLGEGGEHARAVILPGGPPYTLGFFANDAMDRAENYDTIDLALFRAGDIKRSLADDGWTEDSSDEC